MSDPFSDAHRPDNKPKGFGFWPTNKQKEYCQRLYDKGSRDEWLILKMYYLKLLSDDEVKSIFRDGEDSDQKSFFSVADFYNG